MPRSPDVVYPDLVEHGNSPGSRPLSPLPPVPNRRVEPPSTGPIHILTCERNLSVKTFADLGLGPSSSTPWRPRASTTPSPSSKPPSKTRSPATTCAAKRRPVGQDARLRLADVAARQRRAPGHPTALVLVPTRELAKQVVDVLSPLGQGVGIRVAAFYGGTSMERQIEGCAAASRSRSRRPVGSIDLLERNELDLDEVAIARHRRSRPHGRHGLPPAGRVDPASRHRRSPDPLVLRDARPRGRRARAALHARPGKHEVCPETKTVDEMTHRFLKVHELDRVKVLAAIAGGVDRTMVFVAPSAAPTDSSRS